MRKGSWEKMSVALQNQRIALQKLNGSIQGFEQSIKDFNNCLVRILSD